jgi:hypothetical protein
LRSIKQIISGSRYMNRKIGGRGDTEIMLLELGDIDYSHMINRR